MKIREENCNMVLLATVTVLSAAIAGIIALVDPGSAGSVQSMDGAMADQTSVRTVGVPFVPNVNPRER